jgi:hypothetical protein
MKTINKILSIVVAMGLIAIVLFLALSIAGPVFSANFSALLAPTSTPSAGQTIPLKPIDDLTSLNATVKINVNGLINGERAQGDLNAVVTTNDQEESKVTVTGSLLGEIAAQVGGSVVGLFTPSSVDLYKVPEGTYIVANSFIPVCVKPEADKIPEELDDVSPQSLLSMLTSSDVARGVLVGEETLNGTAVKHYVLDGDAFLAAAQKSSDPKLRAFGEALWSAEDADLYVDAKGGYPVAFSGSFSGEYEPLKFEGDFDVEVQLTGVNKNTPVNLPAACNNPITP